MHKILVLLISIFIFKESVSQLRETDFKNITQQDGLPSNEVYCVFKDSKNYIWIGTDQGVVRCNGNKMEKFELPDNVVFKIKEDGKGRVWFFTHSGRLSYFENEKIFPYKYNTVISTEIKRLLITNAYVTNDDEVLLNSLNIDNYKITASGKIIEQGNRFNNPEAICYIDISKQRGNDLFTQKRDNGFFQYSKMVFSTPFNSKLQIISKQVNGIFKQYGCIRGNANEVYFFGWKYLIKLLPNGEYILKELPQEILSICYDSAGSKLFVGSFQDGVKVYDDHLNLVQENILTKLSVSSITIDDEGGLWFSTLKNGIYYSLKKYQSGNFSNRSFSTDIHRLYNHNDTVLLAADLNGLNKIINKKVIQIEAQKSIRTADLFVDRNNEIYWTIVPEGTVVLNSGKRKHLNDDLFKQVNIVFSGFELLNLKGNVYIDNMYNQLALITGKTALENMTTKIKDAIMVFNGFKVDAMWLRDSNSILLGSINDLSLLYLSKKSVVSLKKSFPAFSNGVTCIRQLPNNLFTIGIRFGGVALMKDTSVIATITEKEGLLDNSIKYLLPDGNRLWVATPKGISAITFTSYNPIAYNIKNFGDNAGLGNQIIYQLIKFKGNVLAATSKGIYEITDVEKLLQEKPIPIPLYITNINSYKGDTSGISSITVPYNYSRVTVKFNAICFNTPKEVQYFYRIVNKDSAWFNIETTELILQDLSSGEYALEFKAVIPKQSRISAIQKLTIHVEGPWWKKNSVMALAVLLIAGVLFLLYKWRIRQIKSKIEKENNMQSKMAELEQTALRSQMNPHFIFNCLTSIQQLIATGNKDEANEYLVKFSRLIRNTLELSARQYIAIIDEVEYIKEYVAMEQLRVADTFEFNFKIDENINTTNIEIPNMMIQPIVENAIRHGIKHLQNKKGKIDVELIKIEDVINCTVTDNGVGRTLKAENKRAIFDTHKSYGMNIVMQRLQGLAGKESAIYFMEIIDLYNNVKEPAGTKVILHLPYKTI